MDLRVRVSDLVRRLRGRRGDEGRPRGLSPRVHKQSTRGWGTRDAPAPVLGLEPGGRCVGLAVRIDDGRADEIRARIDEREGPSYTRSTEDVHLDDGRTVGASVWINERNFTYIGDEQLENRARMAVTAAGEHGAAVDYVLETRRTLRELGETDPRVEEFSEKITELAELAD